MCGRTPSSRRTRSTALATTYEIRVQGHLSPQWSARFEGMEITLKADGETALIGPVVDQARLFGIIKSVRDLGLPLVCVRRLAAGPSTTNSRKR